MKIKLNRLPAIHLGDGTGIPGRDAWDILVTGDESAALSRVAELLAETPESFPLTRAERPVLASAVSAVEMVARPECDSPTVRPTRPR
jgi:hypothetical protein